MKKFLSISLFVLALFSCNQKSNNRMTSEEKTNNIDLFIKKYNQTDFSEFKNAFVTIRQKDHNEVIYLIHKFENSLPVYFVTYDLQQNSITNINRDLLKKSGIEDYYTDETISNLVYSFQKYDFGLLGVDSNNNVFINPFEINTPAVLLRLSSKTNEKQLKKGYTYTHYKDNWYLRD